MKIALIADLHGNRPATEALERDLKAQGADALWCLGDVVGKGPSSDYTCDWAFANCDLILAGNWDLGVGGKQYAADAFYWNQIGPERLQRLRALPLEHTCWLSGRHIRLFHGRPIMEELLTPQADSALLDPFFVDDNGVSYDMVAYADLHRQGMRTLTQRVFLNIGSVGNALGVNNCCYALLEGEMGDKPAPIEIRLRQLPYDRERAARDAENANGLRHADAYAREVRTGKYSRGNLPPEVLTNENK